MREILLLIMFALPLSVFSQSGGDTIPKLKISNIEDGSEIGEMEDETQSENANNIKTSRERAESIAYRPMRVLNLDDLNITQASLNEYYFRNYYLGPPTELSYSRNPYANDYGLYAIHGLSHNVFISTSSIRSTTMGIGSGSIINAQLHYQPANWLVISGGPSVGKFNMYGDHYNDMGVNGNMKFIVSDRVSFNAFGQYWKRGRSSLPSTSLPTQQSYGGTMEYRISDKFGVGAGVERELDPFTGKWRTSPIIYPIFYSK